MNKKLREDVIKLVFGAKKVAKVHVIVVKPANNNETGV